LLPSARDPWLIIATQRASDALQQMTRSDTGYSQRNHLDWWTRGLAELNGAQKELIDRWNVLVDSRTL
jgi:hypothetical protein